MVANVTASGVSVATKRLRLGFGDGGIRDLVTGEVFLPEGRANRLSLDPWRVVWLVAEERAA